MIVTTRLRLRPFTMADLDALLAYRRDPEVARYQSWSETFSEADGRAFIEAVSSTPLGTPNEWVNYVIERTGAVIGDVGLRVGSEGAQIGFTLSRTHQGHGYAAEAVEALCDFALQRCRLIYAITDTRNFPSIRLLERLGFFSAGFHARQAPFKGGLCDELRFERSALE